MDDRVKVAEATPRFWLELREPRCVPERKGSWPVTMKADILREFMAARPTAYITVVTITEAGPDFDDGPEALEILDGRSKATAARHRQTTHAARASDTGRSEAEGGKPGVVPRKLSPEEAQARVEALADARRRERDAESRALQPGGRDHG